MPLVGEPTGENAALTASVLLFWIAISSKLLSALPGADVWLRRWIKSGGGLNRWAVISPGVWGVLGVREGDEVGGNEAILSHECTSSSPCPWTLFSDIGRDEPPLLGVIAVLVEVWGMTTGVTGRLECGDGLPFLVGVWSCCAAGGTGCGDGILFWAGVRNCCAAGGRGGIGTDVAVPFPFLPKEPRTASFDPSLSLGESNSSILAY